MTKRQKGIAAVLSVVVLVMLVLGCFLLRKDKQVQGPAHNQLQTSKNQSPAQRAIYAVCGKDQTDIFAYDVDGKKAEKIFSDADKDYFVTCGRVAYGTDTEGALLIKDRTLSFVAEDKKSHELSNVSLNLDSDKETVSKYIYVASQSINDNAFKSEDVRNLTVKMVAVGSSAETTANSLNVLTATLKKSYDGSKILFSSDGGNLFVADDDYKNIMQVDTLAVRDIMPGLDNPMGNWVQNIDSWGWLPNGKIFLSDIAKSTGEENNESLILSPDGKNLIPVSYSIADVPAQAVISDDDFMAVIKEGDNKRIVLMNSNTGKITREFSGGEQFSVSPDGDEVFYVNDEDNNLFIADTGDNTKGSTMVKSSSGNVVRIIGWLQ
jgi:hypothetical protein